MDSAERTGTQPVHTASRKRQLPIQDSGGGGWTPVVSRIRNLIRIYNKLIFASVGRAMPGQLASGRLLTYARHQKVSSVNAWQRGLLKAGS